MTIIILKFFHFLAIFVGGGIGIGGAVVQSAHIKAGEPPRPHVAKALRTLGLLGLGAIAVLWLTGMVLALSIYGGLAINGAFHVKLTGATIMVAASAYANFHIHDKASEQQPPNMKVMKTMTSLTRLGLVLALGGAAAAFSG